MSGSWNKERILSICSALCPSLKLLEVYWEKAVWMVNIIRWYLIFTLFEILVTSKALCTYTKFSSIWKCFGSIFTLFIKLYVPQGSTATILKSHKKINDKTGFSVTMEISIHLSWEHYFKNSLLLISIAVVWHEYIFSFTYFD